jgi:starch synthase
MRVGLLTREYPPDVYGGAGVHVEFLARELRSLVDLDVHCWGADREGAYGHTDPHGYRQPAFATMDIAVSMADALAGHALAHSHTWYANLGGHLAKLAHGIPHVITAHSLEPLRPWKAEQLGGGYRVSSWIERTAFEFADAIIAVSAGMRRDVLDAYPAVPPERVHVVHNGIDTKLYQPVSTTDAVRAHGIDPDRPYVLFVGRITRQKGVPHLVRAAASFAPGTQVVLCAGGADTPDLDAEFRGLVAELQATRDGVFWIPEMLPREQVVELLTHAAVFACPSVYEPLGIVNLEAMACGTAVVASDVGGIPEVVEDGVTGLLVHYDEHDTAAFEAGLAVRVNELVGDRERATAMGAAGRTRAVEDFGWAAIAARTVGIYQASGRPS